ncbi:large ribosomal RNA subunit accumulation protein YCED homolog 2, chloroplastic isoform X3 [Cucurbita pepo subsp. pepo]|uniref:large ribosomal RNA subunit accumulation protein YCED homolog 2, chloroplastic isoform X3 n=1 Tax=Cucurbita pepo subsp. pepo TaxID=3664 RepID=UPI000C9D62D3|nr:large ribosomal RNA subunit accumulation protein YCED homolog 2, chloroplastic isoform X3 [Cucurbita pepo subsp. pepo]
MAEAGHLVAAGNVNSISSSFNKAAAPKFATQAFKIKASSKRNDISLRRSSKPPRRLITISTAGSMWQGKWSYDYLLSLQDFNLEDLVEDEHKNAHVFINLCIEKINANFNVLVLSSNRAKRETTLPDIGGDDPSVIYVKPGLEADLDSLVRDTIRLTTSTKDTCSELCEKSQPSVQCKWSSCHSSFHTQSKVGTNREMLIADIGAQNAASIDKRWSRLLELRKSHS